MIEQYDYPEGEDRESLADKRARWVALMQDDEDEAPPMEQGPDDDDIDDCDCPSCRL